MRHHVCRLEHLAFRSMCSPLAAVASPLILNLIGFRGEAALPSLSACLCGCVQPLLANADGGFHHPWHGAEGHRSACRQSWQHRGAPAQLEHAGSSGFCHCQVSTWQVLMFGPRDGRTVRAQCQGLLRCSNLLALPDVPTESMVGWGLVCWHCQWHSC